MVQRARRLRPFRRVGRVCVVTVENCGDPPPFRADAAKTQPPHQVRGGLAGDDLGVLAQVGEDLRLPEASSDSPWNQTTFRSMRSVHSDRDEEPRYSQA